MNIFIIKLNDEAMNELKKKFKNADIMEDEAIISLSLRDDSNFRAEVEVMKN